MDEKNKEMKKLKGACIGLGYFSLFHIEAWQRLSKVKIIAVCDTDIEKARQIANSFNIESYYDNIDDMLEKEDIDFIDIITPPNTHKTLCLKAAKKGVHIICQKPLAPSLKEANEIASYVAKYNIRIMVHENFRFQPWHREIKKLLEQNLIGKNVHAIHWRMRMGDGWQKNAYIDRQPYFREMEQLLMYETGIHLIDVLRYFGGDIISVYAKLMRLSKNIKGEDFAWVMCDFKKGGAVFIDMNRYNESTFANPRLTFGSLLIEGDKGSIRLHEDGTITKQLLGKKALNHKYSFEDRNFSGDCVYFTQKHFLKHLQTGNPFETDIETYLPNIAILEKIYESNHRRMPLKV